MNQENTRKLNERFPFLTSSGNMNQDLMMFGFECGDGWFQLIWDLCEKIEKEGISPHFRAMQVKEKFGSLRFYVNIASDEVLNAIDEAEKKSETICELCGEPGRIRNGSWLKCRCEKCNEGIN
jgi:hypothetical protein